MISLKPVAMVLVQLLLFSTQALAQSEKGNGGNAVVCFQSARTVKRIMKLPEVSRGVPNWALKNITSIRLLDLYDVGVASDLNLKAETAVPLFEPLANEDNAAYIDRLASRFDVHSPFFGRLLRKNYSELNQQVFKRSSSDGLAGISQVGDYGAMKFQIDQELCVIATLASQNSDGRLEVDGRLYHHPKHSEMSRKALIVHEVIFREGIPLGVSAPAVRQVTALLIQSKLSRTELIERYYRGGFRRSLEEVDPAVYKSFYGEFAPDPLKFAEAFDEFLTFNSLKRFISEDAVNAYYDGADQVARNDMIYVRWRGPKMKTRAMLEVELASIQKRGGNPMQEYLIILQMDALDREFAKNQSVRDRYRQHDLERVRTLRVLSQKVLDAYPRCISNVDQAASALQDIANLAPGSKPNLRSLPMCSQIL